MKKTQLEMIFIFHHFWASNSMRNLAKKLSEVLRKNTDGKTLNVKMLRV